MQQGYIRLYRCILDKGWHNKPDYVAAWVYILMRGNYKESEVMVDGKILVLKPGQFLTSRKQMAIATGVSESKIQRILSLFENEHQIEQQTFSKNRAITITNWGKYQASEHQNEPIVNSKRTASEQQVNTDNKGNKERRKEENLKSSLPEGLNDWCRKARAAIGKNMLSPNDLEVIKAWSAFTSEEIESACSIAKERGGKSVGYLDAILRTEHDKVTPTFVNPPCQDDLPDWIYELEREKYAPGK